MEFCCPMFTALIGQAGERGIAVLVRRAPKGFDFVLQSRALAVEHQDQSAGLGIPRTIPFNIMTSFVMRFCPCCGKNLQKLVTMRNVGELLELVEKHKAADDFPG